MHAAGRHASFLLQLAVVATAAYRQSLTFYETHYFVVVLVHYLLVLGRDMSGSPSIQTDVRCAVEAADCDGSVGPDSAGSESVKNHHFAQSVRYLLMFAVVFSACTLAEGALAVASFGALSGGCAAVWLVVAGRDVQSMWRILWMYWRIVRARRRPRQ